MQNEKKNIICVSIPSTLYHIPSGEGNIEFNFSTIFVPNIKSFNESYTRINDGRKHYDEINRTIA